MRMSQKICFFMLLGTLSVLLLIPSMIPPAISAQNNLWPEIGRHISLDYQFGEQPEVDSQIRWYVQHPKILQNLLVNAQPYLYYVYQQVRERHLPAELALIPFIESSYNPFAQSAAGATGLWQMMPATAADYGLKITPYFDSRLDILASTQAALTHFTALHNYFGDWLLAIAAYDAGAGTIKTTLAQQAAVEQATDIWSLHLPSEARFYLAKLIALATIVKDPYQFHLALPPIANKPFFSAVLLDRTINLYQVAQTTQTDMHTLRRLNPGFSLQSNIIPKGDYALLIPKDNKTKL